MVQARRLDGFRRILYSLAEHPARRQHPDLLHAPFGQSRIRRYPTCQRHEQRRFYPGGAVATSPRGEKLELVTVRLSGAGQLAPQVVGGRDAEPFGRNLPVTHRDLRGVDHQLVAGLPECHREILREVTDGVRLPLRVQVAGLQLEQPVAPRFQVVEQVTG